MEEENVLNTEEAENNVVFLRKVDVIVTDADIETAASSKSNEQE